MEPPLAVDIDGTLTGPDRALDPRVIPVLRDWEAPVVVATGKAMPYPVALCEFVGMPPTVVAENGGVVYVAAADALSFEGDTDAVAAFERSLRDRDLALGWGDVDLVNRWRETEVAVSTDHSLEQIRAIAAEVGLRVVDSGYAYHVKSPAVDKATGLRTAAGHLGREPGSFLAVGDSENDAELFALAGESVAVANADDAARAAADRQTAASYGDGFLEAVAPYRTDGGR